MEEKIDVLICGAGAAGLTLALDFARRGVSFRIVEKMCEPFAGSRGKGIQPRTLEVFEDLGIVDRLFAVGGFYPPRRVYREDGSYIERSIFDPQEPRPDVPYALPLMVPQFLTERVMRERLGERGRQVEFGRELVGLEQSEDGVFATLLYRNGEERVAARFLIGADGGRSFVRNALEIGFPGKTLEVRAIVADVALTGLDREAWHQFGDGDRKRTVAICPLAGTDLFQIQAPVPPEGEVDLTAAGLDRMVAERSRREDIRVRSVSWASAYSMNARLADRYRAGRVFLVGDAAHIHPPTGGQGLNTSVQDAYNLGWKLAAVLAGAPEALLDSYEAERRPVAEDVLGLSTRLLGAQREPGGMRRGRETQQLDIGYPASSLSLDAQARSSALTAGNRMPDAALVGAAGQPRRLFDLLAGPQWTLLRSTQSYAPAMPGCHDIRVISIGPSAELRDPGNQLGLADGDCLLIRPDGYIGASLDAANAAHLDAYVAQHFPHLLGTSTAGKPFA